VQSPVLPKKKKTPTREKATAKQTPENNSNKKNLSKNRLCYISIYFYPLIEVEVYIP
jgi:hypothetical protein